MVICNFSSKLENILNPYAVPFSPFSLHVWYDFADASAGSCWAFSSTGAIEGINAISTGELISLSEQELLDCDKTNDGCDGGYMDYAFGWVINNGGIDTEANYPYTGVDGTCNSTNVWILPWAFVSILSCLICKDSWVGIACSTQEANKIVSIDGYENVAESEEALLCAAVNQPVSVGIQGSAMDFQLYTGVSN